MKSRTGVAFHQISGKVWEFLTRPFASSYVIFFRVMSFLISCHLSYVVDGFLVCSGMVAALTNESATSKSVYFALCTSEMIYITHLLSEEPERLAGPLLADTYVTLLKGRNAWYGYKVAKGELLPAQGDNVKGKGMIQVQFLSCSSIT